VIILLKAITVFVTEEQYEKLHNRKIETGNSQNSIIRTALNQYFGGNSLL
jgi:hypothetical protein